MSSVSVIIPARDAGETIARTLAGLASQLFDDQFEVIVVDDGSSDSTPELIRRSPVAVRVVKLDGVGPARARNAGASAASGEILAFLDADCFPTPPWLQAGLSALASADLVQGATYPDPAESVGPFDRSLWVRRPTGLFESANLFVTRQLFERLNGFESWLGPANGKELGEDVWFGWRASRAGARIGFSEQAVAHHAVFKRGVTGYVAERARLRFFPELAGRIPELREHFFYRRWFMSRRSAAYDLALAGLLMAGGARKPLALVAVMPYATQLKQRAGGGGARHAGRIVAAELAADSVGFVALLAGSARSGAPVL